jgi:uncharacterized protein YdiU (UPF0061 family)
LEGQCLSVLLSVGREKYHATYARLGTRLGFNWEQKASGDQIELALDVLHCERERVKTKFARLAELRREEKRQGRRQFIAAKYAWLYEPDFLEFPHPEPLMVKD